MNVLIQEKKKKIWKKKSFCCVGLQGLWAPSSGPSWTLTATRPPTSWPCWNQTPPTRSKFSPSASASCTKPMRRSQSGPQTDVSILEDLHSTFHTCPSSLFWCYHSVLARDHHSGKLNRKSLKVGANQCLSYKQYTHIVVFLFDQLYEAHRKHIKTKTEEWNQASRNDEQFIAVRLNFRFCPWSFASSHSLSMFYRALLWIQWAQGCI